jgi:HK97 family phage portal protein
VTLIGSALAARADVRAAAQAENPQHALTSDTLLQALGVEQTYTGKNVSEVTALGMSAVWRAVHVTTAVPAALPFHAFREQGAARVRATGHAARLLDDPHPDLTPLELWQTSFVHKRLWGNAYLRKLRNPLGQIVELWPVHPGRVRVGRESENGRKVYVIDGDTDHPLSDREILHLPGLGYDGVCGVSPIRAARQSIALGMAAEEFGAKLFGNGSLATGILQTEQRLTQAQADKLASRWNEKRAGLQSAHGTIVLDKGSKFHQLTIPPEDAQFLESRRFQIVEVCRWFGLPPFLMFETEKSTSWGTGLEQQALGWVKFDLGPELTAIEQRVSKHVLKPEPVYAHYALEGLLRGDSAARSAFYTAMWNLGVFSTNEIRAYEELEPVDGGDVRYRPLAMGVLGTTDDPVLEMADKSDAEVALDVVEMVQKVYLGVGIVIDEDEARELLNRAGANLDGHLDRAAVDAAARAALAPVPDLVKEPAHA